MINIFNYEKDGYNMTVTIEEIDDSYHIERAISIEIK